VFTARYAMSPYIKQIHFVFKGLKVALILVGQDLWIRLYVTLLSRRLCGVVASVYMLITSAQSCGMLTSVMLAICDGCFTAHCSPGGR
jgi:hypothetical protein